MKNNSTPGRTLSSNALADETSPYLLQHAHNPVQWYPWCEEALERARVEDKPILLSIGYSACHWCHVMAHESFENESIARLMNENFINIKVDREERPDLDYVYQNVVQMLTGQGGWPLTVFLTPEQKPFWGGTYFPPDNRYGRPGFPAVLMAVREFYHQQREKVQQLTQEIEEALKVVTATPADGRVQLDTTTLSRAAERLLQLFDEHNGGFGRAPKFPHAKALEVFLRHFAHTGDRSYLARVTHTLRKMAEGGIYDQLGGGFHRYSVDERWLVPHFEKMLYDNALLAKLLCETYQATGDNFFAQRARETLDYVLREMTHPEGGFYSSQDADSEGEEGKYFLWTPGEVFALLEDRAAAIICEHLGITGAGNFDGEKSVLHVRRSLEDIAHERRMRVEEVEQIVNEGKKVLLAAREQRVKPLRDEKVLTDWNGLMISSFALAAQVFDDTTYRAAARRAADFVLHQLWRQGRLLHCYKDGRARFAAYLDDYAYFAQGLLDLFEVTFDRKYLLTAIDLADTMISLFWDEENQVFFFTPGDHQSLFHRPQQAADHSTPSGQSVAVFVLLRLFHFTGRDDYRAKAEAVFKTHAGSMEENPLAFASLICALDFHLSSPVEIVFVGGETAETQALLRQIHYSYRPNKLLAGITSENAFDTELEAKVPLLQGKKALDGKTTVYLCAGFTCGPPITDPDEVMRQLDASQRR